MAETMNYKVSYVRITDEGLERHTDVYLSDISMEDRRDIKSIIFLPVETQEVIDITSELKGFPILEQIFLPSSMTTTIKAVIKECPMLKSLLLLTQNPIRDSLDKTVVKVNAKEEEGDGFAEFRTFVETTKDGKQTFYVNSKQVLNHEVEIIEKIIERITPNQVTEYISGENGIIHILDQINGEIEDERCKIEITQETLESLLGIFVEKGVTFEEFTIDFSKLYDKIESYKTIVKTVNQVSIKEEIEGNIVESYQNVLRVHYENLLSDLAPKMLGLAKTTTLDNQDLLLTDLKTYIANVLVESPVFDEDYRESAELISALDELPTAITRNIRSSTDRALLRKYLAQAISELKTDKQDLFTRTEEWLDAKTDVLSARNTFARAFGLDLEKKPSQKLADTFINALVKKDFGTLTKDDVSYVIERIKNGISNEEISGKELIKLIEREVEGFATKQELKDSIVEFVEKNGYSLSNNSNV